MSASPINLLFGEKGAERTIRVMTTVILLLLVALSSGIVFYMLSSQLASQLESSLTRTLLDKEFLVNSAINAEADILENAAVRRPRLRELLIAATSGGERQEDLREIGTILDSILLSRSASAIELTDKSGKVIGAAGEFAREPRMVVALQHPAQARLLWHGQYVVQVSSVLQENGMTVGVLKMEVPLTAVTRVMQDYRGMGETGEVVICAPLPHERMRCFPSRHSPDGIELPYSIDGMALPMSYALQGKNGVIRTRDYRRQEVVDVYQPLGSSGLGIVAKIDSVELMRPVIEKILLILPFVVALVILGTLLLHWLVGPLLRKVVSSESELKRLHDELRSNFEALELSQEGMLQAELEKGQQMKALAEANVRMMLFHSAMEQLRQFNTSLSDKDENFSHSILINAMELTGAKYGALGLFDEKGGLRKFLTQGISAEERQAIGGYPLGKGLLQAVYKENKVLRVDRIAGDPRFCGFPAGHPTMTCLLGVPLVVDGATKGAIYLTNKRSGEPFNQHDEMIMELLAGEVGRVLERSELIAHLSVSNLELTKERMEQQVLISKLQEAQSHLMQSEKMASIGQLAAGVAHEINNPIGFVYSNLGALEKYVLNLFGMLDAYEQAESEIASSGIREQLQEARKKLDIAFLKDDLHALMNESKEGITRVKNIVQNLKDFSHVDASDEWHYSDLHAGLNSTLNIVNNEIKYKAEVVKEYGDIPQVECLPSQLNQVFMNLLVNASHAIDERGTITIRTGRKDDEVWVEVVDTGKGIPAENLKKIFDPFFTTKPIGKGTGLGLSLSYGIIQKHHGRIEVQSEVGKGTAFRVWLPLQQPPAGAA